MVRKAPVRGDFLAEAEDKRKDMCEYLAESSSYAEQGDTCKGPW